MEQDDYVFEWAMKNPIPATKKGLYKRYSREKP